MPTIELLAVNWDRPDRSKVLKTVPSNSLSPADLNQTARGLLAETPSCDGYQVKDDQGQAVIVYYEKKL